MKEIIELRKNDTLFDRPFTHPEYVALDRATLCIMIEQVCLLLEQCDDAALAPGPIIHYLPAEEKWQKRTVIMRPDQLAVLQPLSVVGFFGQKRFNVCPKLEAEIFLLGRQLIECFHNLPDILGYFSMLLPDAYNYANLVLLKRQDVIAHWREMAVHQRAAGDLSKDYYANVRIYNGLLPSGGLQNSTQLQLTQVKYFDYQSNPVWRAVRILA